MRLRVINGAPWVVETLEGGWVALGRPVVQGGRVVVAELRIVPAGKGTPPGGIDHDVVRRVPCGRFGPYVLAAASVADHAGIGGLQQHFAQTIGVLLPKLTTIHTRPRPRRARGRDDRFYADLARDYLDVIARGSRSSIQDLAATRGEKPSKVRDMVHEARERGLLTRSDKGQAGGRLTARAIEILGVSPRTRQRRTR